MKQLKILFAAIMLFGMFSCENNSENKNYKLKSGDLARETPALRKEKINLGKIKRNAEGNSAGNRTELTELLRILNSNEHDIIEIKWVWDSSPVYDDMPMKISYNKIQSDLKLIYLKNNVKEEFSNVYAECLTDFLKNGEKSFYSLEAYCEDSKFDFNNRDMTKRTVGKKPKQSEIDGSVFIVAEYLKENSNDASSIEFIEWSKVSEFGEFWVVRVKYKGANKLGVIESENKWFYIQNNKVVDTKAIL